MPYDLFVSYSRRDNTEGRITQLVERIKADFANFEGNNGRGLVPFFDQQEIVGMQDWRQRILQGLRESRLLLACLSPAYLKSEYCEWEFVEYLKYEIGHLHGFNGVAPIYFVEVPGWTDKNFEQQCAAWIAELRKRQHFDLRPWHDIGEAALREVAVQERMQSLNVQIAATIMRGERAEKSLGNVDAHNPHFIGRTANLRMLRENFVTPGHIGVVTAVNGVGGLGKTALAIEYAHAFADEYGGGRWQVRCAGKDDLRLALAELATPIGFEFTDDEKKNADLQFERTRRELRKLADAHAPHRCLLLLDNVDRPGLLDPAQVARLNGGDWLHVLATTRLGENELHGAHRDRSFLAIDELPPDDALALIESYQPGGRFRSEAERHAARDIVRLLGSFTLAVESAAVYLGQFANDVTCAAFLARLKKEGLEGLDTAASQSSEGVLHGEKRLSATLQPTLERLGAAEKLALEFAALLPPDQVPLPWLRALVAKTFPEMERDAEPGYPDPWKNVLRGLLSLRLLTLGGHPKILRIHRMVAAHITLGIKLESKAGLRDELLRHAEAAATELDASWVHDRESLWQLGPLQELVSGFALDIRTPALARIAGIVGDIESTVGRLDKAILFLTLAVQLDEETIQSQLDSDSASKQLSVSLSRLATAYGNRHSEGDTDRSRSLFERSTEITRRRCKANPSSISHAANLVISLLQQADSQLQHFGSHSLAAARALLEEAHAVASRHTQSAVPWDAARSFNSVHYKFGRYCERLGTPSGVREAATWFKKYFETAIQLRNAKPDSIQACRDAAVASLALADAELAAGQNSSAIAHLTEGFSFREEQLASAPDSMQALSDMAVLLERLCRAGLRDPSTKATEMVMGYARRLLDITTAMLKRNPDSLKVAHDVVNALSALGDCHVRLGSTKDIEKAENFFRRCVVELQRINAANETEWRSKRDLAVSWMKLADCIMSVEGVEQRKEALMCFQKSSDIFAVLLAASPTSVQAATDSAVAYLRTSECASANQESQRAAANLSACFGILSQLDKAGCLSDPKLIQLFRMLKSALSKGE